MFEQQIEETIQTLSRRTIGDEPSINLKTILGCEIPEAIKRYFELDVKPWIVEEKARLSASPHFDYGESRVRDLFDEVVRISRPYIVFTREEFELALERAVKLYFNYLCRPQRTFSKFIFGDKNSIGRDVILQVLDYFIEYEYYRVIIKEYLQNKSLEEVQRERFEELISIIDNEIIKTFDTRKLATLTEPIFDLFAITDARDPQRAPVEALSVFFDDKNISTAVERLDVEKEQADFITMHDLVMVLSEVDFSASVDISNIVSRHFVGAAVRRPASNFTESTLPPVAEFLPEEEEPVMAESSFSAFRGEQPASSVKPVYSWETVETANEDRVSTENYETEKAPDEHEDPFARELAKIGLESGEYRRITDPEETSLKKEEFPMDTAGEDLVASFSGLDDPFLSSDEPRVAPPHELVTAVTEDEAEAFAIEDYEVDNAGLNLSLDEVVVDPLVASAAEPPQADWPEPIAADTTASTVEEKAAADENDLDIDALLNKRIEPIEPSFAGLENLDPMLGTDFQDSIFSGGTHETPALDQFIIEEEPPASKLDPDKTESFLVFDDSIKPRSDSGKKETEPGLIEMPGFESEDTAVPDMGFAATGMGTDDLLDMRMPEFMPFDIKSEPEPEKKENTTDFDAFLSDQKVSDENFTELTFDNVLAADQKEPFQLPDSTAGDLEIPSDLDMDLTDALQPMQTPGMQFGSDADIRPTPPEPNASGFDMPVFDLRLEAKDAASVEEDAQPEPLVLDPSIDADMLTPVPSDPNTDVDDLKDLMRTFTRGENTPVPMATDNPVGTFGDLKTMINPKDKKLYVKSIFRNKESEYDKSIDDLNGKATWREASEYIDDVFLKFDVDMYSKIAVKFTDEIYKRYMPK